MKTLEQEFTETIKRHKYDVIAATLIVYEEDGIYNHPLLKNDYENVKGDTIDKAYKVTDDLEKRSHEGEDDFYEEVYKVCWDKMKDIVDDTKAYGISDEERTTPIGELKKNYI
jgi:hypothetical protein